MKKPSKLLPLALLALPLVCVALWADDEKKDEKKEKGAPLTLTDVNDKKHKVTEWTWKSGTRRLSWLAEDEGKPKDKPKKGKQAVGPEAFVLREVSSQPKNVYVNGVLTLIPLDRLRSLSIDVDKKMLSVKAATGEKENEEVSLEGSIKFEGGINRFSFEADVDQGDAGIASFKFDGGSKGNIKSVVFPAEKVDVIKGTRNAVVQTSDTDGKKTHKVSDLMPLYVTGNREKTHHLLMFRKTLKLDVNKIESITDSGEDSDDVVWRVKQKGSDETTLTLLVKTTIDDQAAQLVGFVGKTPIGYKLFPVPRVRAIHFDATEAPPDNLLPDPKVEKVEEKKKDK